MKKIFILVCSIMMLASCEEYLEVTPKNEIALLNYDDVKSLMGGYLLQFNSSTHALNSTNTIWSGKANLQFHFYSDDLRVEDYLGNWKGRNNRGLFLQSLEWKEEFFPGSLWKTHFENIGFLNLIIDNINELSGDIPVDDINIVLGEAKMLRAYNLFKVLQLFSPYDNNELGIPFNYNSKDPRQYDSSRQSQTVCYNAITSDLEEILAYSTTPKEGFNIFYDKKMINALLAKVYHYKGGSGAAEDGDYTKAIDYASVAMQGRSLATISDISSYNLFDKSVASPISKEEEYALFVYVPAEYERLDFGDLFGLPDWGLNQYASQSLVDLYNPNDVRASSYVNISNDGLILKFSKVVQDKYYYLFRVAELQLIIAESYARMGDDANATLYLEELQSNRISGYTGYTGSNILQEVLDERRRELCYEYDTRWTDLARLKTGWERPAVESNDNEITSYIMEDNDYRFTLPIPLNEELKYNKIPQNPGWPIF